MPDHIIFTAPVMFWAQPRLKSINICGLVRIDVPHLPHYVFLQMAYRSLRLSNTVTGRGGQKLTSLPSVGCVNNVLYYPCMLWDIILHVTVNYSLLRCFKTTSSFLPLLYQPTSSDVLLHSLSAYQLKSCAYSYFLSTQLSVEPLPSWINLNYMTVYSTYDTCTWSHSPPKVAH